MTIAPETYYQILGITQDATPDQIATARRSMLKQVHPDLATNDADRDERERLSRAVNEMCDTLLDPVRRWDYDRSLARSRPVSAHPVDDHPDPSAGDDRWEPAAPSGGHGHIQIPGLDWLDEWLTWRIAGLSVLMLGLSILVYDTIGGRLLDRIGLHFGRFGSLGVVLASTVVLVALCLGLSRWIRGRRTGQH